jgi:hypothetical protein
MASQDFSSDGTFVVPIADALLVIECWGAGGYLGGSQGGSYAKAAFTGIALGESLFVHCGSGPRGSYGVAADVRRGGDALANRIIVAGGGGSAGQVSVETSNGLQYSGTGSPITLGAGSTSASNGTDATLTGPGYPGGTLGYGGDGDFQIAQGDGTAFGTSGRGGDGYYGGGAGTVSVRADVSTSASAGGGGRGSSYTGAGTDAVVNLDARGGASIVKISWSIAPRPPNIPLLVSPINTAMISSGDDVLFQWVFSDPDAGATQSRWQLEAKPTGGSVAVNKDVSSKATSWLETFTTFTVGNWEWRVRTYDQTPLVSPWSAWEPFSVVTPATPPVITAPANGAVITLGTAAVNWSVTNQDVYELRRVLASDRTVLYTTGAVSNSTTRTHTLTFPDNHQSERIELRVRYNNVWSVWVAVNVSTDFLGPMTPTLVVTPYDDLGWITVAITSPAPTGGRPPSTGFDVWVRVISGRPEGRRPVAPADGIRIVTTTALIYNDDAAASEVPYEYRVRAIASNQTSTWSEWTP